MALKDMRVFIVDDYTTMLRILRNLLRQLDINNVEEATNGDTADPTTTNFDYVLDEHHGTTSPPIPFQLVFLPENYTLLYFICLLHKTIFLIILPLVMTPSSNSLAYENGEYRYYSCESNQRCV